VWSVASILTGLQSFFLEEHPTSGSVSCSPAGRRQLARESLAHCARSPAFAKLFPEVVEEQLARRATAEAEAAAARAAAGLDAVAGVADCALGPEGAGGAALAALGGEAAAGGGQLRRRGTRWRDGVTILAAGASATRRLRCCIP